MFYRYSIEELLIKNVYEFHHLFAYMLDKRKHEASLRKHTGNVTEL